MGFKLMEAPISVSHLLLAQEGNPYFLYGKTEVNSFKVKAE